MIYLSILASPIVYPIVGVTALVLIVLAFMVGYAAFFKKAIQGQALIVTAKGKTKVSFDGILVYPVINRMELMDISIKKLEIERLGEDGLICKDNMRADIKVAFFVRVNKSEQDVINVAQIIGCERASDIDTLKQLFEAKFSEALKTVGKRFDFVELYDNRSNFRDEIVNEIGRDLNGYMLDDCAIDYLEQTPIEFLKSNNILDAEGIKKITDLTAVQNMKSNLIRREEEKTLKKQDVEAREAILELEKQLAEKEAKQAREVANIVAREDAETAKVVEEERLKSETARIATEETLQIAEENKQRQVIVAAKNKERTEAIETERVEKDRLLEVTERERIVTLAQIEKEKAIEEEKKLIQDVIRERVIVQKSVVEEEENIKDLQAHMQADRLKKVAITAAEQHAEAALVETIKMAEAEQQSAEFKAKQRIIEADAQQQSAGKEADAIKILADAEAAKYAAVGLSEAQVIEAKAGAMEKQGEAEANIIEAKAMADAKGIEVRSLAQAEADNKLGLAAANVEKERGLAQAEVINAKAQAEEEKGKAEAVVIGAKAKAEAQGIEDKAEAMKKLDGVGRDHEEFKLRLDKQKEVELAEINIQESIADSQALVLSEAMKSANIDIIGGETQFFDNIMASVSRGKALDKFVDSSDTIKDIKAALLGSNGDGDGVLIANIQKLIGKSGIKSEDIKNLTLASLLMNLHDDFSDKGERSSIKKMLDMVIKLDMGDTRVNELNLLK